MYEGDRYPLSSFLSELKNRSTIQDRSVAGDVLELVEGRIRKVFKNAVAESTKLQRDCLLADVDDLRVEFAVMTFEESRAKKMRKV